MNERRMRQGQDYYQKITIMVMIVMMVSGEELE